MPDKISSSNGALWRPSNTASTNISSFMRKANNKHCLSMGSYQELYEWSVTQYEQFWSLWWEEGGFLHSAPPTLTITPHTSIADRPKWFVGARLNFAENLLRFRDEETAIIFTGEGVETVFRQSYASLHASSQAWARALRAAGVKTGSRVAGYLPNCPAAIHAMLGAATLGAIWCSASPDFGVKGVLDRLQQVEPEVLISVEAVTYNGKVHNHLEKLAAVAQALASVRRVVLVPFVRQQQDIDFSAVPNCEFSCEFLASGGSEPVPYKQLPFDAPLFIMFSSGTTGAPKCIVHGAGGTLLQISKEHSLHCDLGRKDVFTYYTTTGWMMWQWLVTGLYSGCCLLLYEGSPLLPHPARLWDLVDEHGVTVLGTGAKWLSVLQGKGVRPATTHNLASLRCILSTGSPLTASSFRYVYQDIKQDLVLGSISGGTDILSCFVGCCPLLEVHPGEVQCRMLGMGVQVWGEDGSPLLDQPGELVCTVPFPSMPTSFWGPGGDEKYLRAYFTQRPGVWSHGDHCQLVSATGGLLMLGRSDGTLNPSGVRFGSAEIYAIVSEESSVLDSVCVGQRRPSDGEERVLLFLKLTPGQQLTQDLRQRLVASIRRQLSARHVPALMLQVEDIPYTTSGKKVEVAVRAVLHGQPVANTSALANPEALLLYADLPQLKDWN